MALVRTTLVGGLTATDTEVSLTSSSGLTLNASIEVDSEIMRIVSLGAVGFPHTVYRGARGTLAQPHPAGAGVNYGAPGDFEIRGYSTVPKKDIVSYSAAGTIANPTPGLDRIAVLNGTVALAMTVGVPSVDNDGDLLIIVGNGKAAHVVTVTGGLGAGGTAVDGLTFAVGAQNSITLIAANGVWVPLGSVYAGTMTNVTVTAA